MGDKWTIGEHSILLTFLSDGLSDNEISGILKRTDGSIRSRKNIIALHYYFTDKYPIKYIADRLSMDTRKVEYIIDKFKGKYKSPTNEYKNCSSFAEVMDMLDKVKKIQMENGTFDMEAYAKLVDYSVKPSGVNIFPK